MKWNILRKIIKWLKERRAFITLLKLSRKQDTVRALNDISFKIDDGEILAYIGPNGAGKSTTIKILCGILTPDKGNCIVDGYVPWKDRKSYVKNIGVVFGQRSQLWWDIPIIDSFELIKDMYDIDSRTYKQNVSELCQLLDLEKIVKTPARNLSLGQRMRCEIVASLLHNPKILFLDEPTSGIDPLTRRNFWRQITSLSKRGTTIIITTHFMDESEYCDRIMIQDAGKLVVLGTPDEVRRIAGDENCTMDEAFISVILEKREQEDNV